MFDYKLFAYTVWQEFLLLLKAPVLVPEMWWIITPLIIITIGMAFYFGKYIRERLGWNTALGNSFVLFFVGIDLLRKIFHYTVPGAFWNYFHNPLLAGIILIIMFEGLLLSYSAFQHALPEKIMFFLTSPLPVNVQAYVLISAVYLRFNPSIYTLCAAILMFVMLYVAIRILQEIEHIRLGYHFAGNKKRKNK